MLGPLSTNYGDFTRNGALRMLGDFDANGNGVANVAQIQGLGALTVESGSASVSLASGTGTVRAHGDVALNAAGVSNVTALSSGTGSIVLQGDGITVPDGPLRISGGNLSLGGNSLARTPLVSSSNGSLALSCLGGSASLFAPQGGSLDVVLPSGAASMRILRAMDDNQVSDPLLELAQGPTSLWFEPCSASPTPAVNSTSSLRAVIEGYFFSLFQVDAVTGNGFVEGGNVRWFASGTNSLTLNPASIVSHQVFDLGNNRIVNVPFPTLDSDMATKASVARTWATVRATTQPAGALSSLTVASSPVGAVTAVGGIITVSDPGTYEIKLTVRVLLTGISNGINTVGELRRASDGSAVLSAHESKVSSSVTYYRSNAFAFVVMPVAQGDTFYLHFTGSSVYSYNLDLTFLKLRV